MPGGKARLDSLRDFLKPLLADYFRAALVWTLTMRRADLSEGPFLPVRSVIRTSL